MNSFPIALNLVDKKILFIGAGKVAYKKIKKLIGYSQNITVLANEIASEINVFDINIVKRYYEKGDVKHYDIVIVSVNDLELQKSICYECKEARILVSSSDFPELSDFSFCSIIKKDDLQIAISTSGISPSFSKELKNHIENSLPSGIKEFLKNMKEKRDSSSKGPERMNDFREATKKFFKTS